MGHTQGQLRRVSGNFSKAVTMEIYEGASQLPKLDGKRRVKLALHVAVMSVWCIGSNTAHTYFYVTFLNDLRRFFVTLGCGSGYLFPIILSGLVYTDLILVSLKLEQLRQRAQLATNNDYQTVRSIHDMYISLVRQPERLIKTLELPLLVFFATSVVAITSSVCFIVEAIAFSSAELPEWQVFSIFQQTIQIILLTTAADMVKSEAFNTRSAIQDLINGTTESGACVNLNINVHMTHPNLEVYGLFKIGRHVVVGFLGAIATYIVLFYQFRNNEA